MTLVVPVVVPPGHQPDSPDSLRLLRQKWDELGVEDPLRRAERFLDSGVSAAELEALLGESAPAQEGRT